MKILVLGAGGMAGHVAVIRLKELGHDVTGFARKPLNFCKTITGDIMTADVPAIVKDFDAVINCIGVLNKAVDEEPYEGIWLNSCLPHLLTIHAKRVIHISTDCVFSGNENGNYKEDSFRSANTMYGRSKALGEINDDKNLTIRTSIVGPDINKNGVGLFNWFMKQRNDVSGYTKAIWTGVTTITLAEAIDAALKQKLTGLYHLVNNNSINKYDLLTLFNKLKVEPIKINSVDDYAVDKSMINTRSDFDFIVPNYSDMVENMGVWIKEHGALYPQYNMKE